MSIKTYTVLNRLSPVKHAEELLGFVFGPGYTVQLNTAYIVSIVPWNARSFDTDLNESIVVSGQMITMSDGQHFLVEVQ